MDENRAAEPTIKIPALSLVVLVGASGSGKSTFARRHFKPTEVLSSDVCRGLVCDDENDQSATAAAFDVLQTVAARRLANGRLTVVDATNVQAESRRPYVALAREYHCIPVAVVLDVPTTVCQERNRARSDRTFSPHVVRQQSEQLRRSLRALKREGFRHVFVLGSQTQIDGARVERQPLWNDLRHEHGPFDIIGDVHGCLDELLLLLDRLGYQVSQGRDGDRHYDVSHPAGRKIVFLGDLVDRGPGVAGVLRLAMDARQSGAALCVPGNHDIKLMRKLKGADVRVTHGLAESLAQLENESGAFLERVVTFIDSLVSHYVLDDGHLVVAHAGMKESMQGRGSGRVRDFALFGETTGETDEYGLPVRHNWSAEYRGKATVVFGHTPVLTPEWLNRTINVDTGCVFGGRLTALRYPEDELVSVPAARTYYEPSKPFLTPAAGTPALSAQQQHDDLLDLEDVSGKRIISTRLHRTVTIRAENGAAALEVMSRFAGDPRWLIYLPPTMSPTETSKVPGLLEHPTEAFEYYRRQGIRRVVCEEKHMGSRAVVVVCRDTQVARQRFGVADGETGICYSRTGRPFFDDPTIEAELLTRVCTAAQTARLFEQLETDWICLDCELMPWSAKAQELLRRQYAPVAAAAGRALTRAVATLEQTVTRMGGDGIATAGHVEGAPVPAESTLDSLLAHQRLRLENAVRYRDAYGRYCWSVRSLADLKLAPFHLLATEGQVHVDKDHLWHLEMLAKLCGPDPDLMLATDSLQVDVTDPESQTTGTAWWEDLTGRGGEGMVVKPLDFVVKGRRGLVQPAVKCRGAEYLRIIYGPDYTIPENLDLLRVRGLSGKRSLALREFALGVEGLERFVRREPLRRVHECVFGVLALESEPVDPRL